MIVELAIGAGLLLALTRKKDDIVTPTPDNKPPPVKVVKPPPAPTGGGIRLPTGLNGGAIGGALGGALGDFWANTVHGNPGLDGTAMDSHTIKEVAVPAYTVVGASVGASVAATVAAAGVAAGAFAVLTFAFPVAVGVWGLLEIGKAIEDSIRLAEFDRRYREVQALVSQKQYAAGFNLANKNADEGYGGCGFKVVTADAVNTALTSDMTSVDGLDTDGVTPRKWRVDEFQAEAYKDLWSAWKRDSALIKSEFDAEVWCGNHGAELAKADEMVAGLNLAMPWFQPHAFEWRPAVKVANVGTGMTGGFFIPPMGVVGVSVASDFGLVGTTQAGANNAQSNTTTTDASGDTSINTGRWH